MKKLIWITKAEVLTNYVLNLTFNDGSYKTFDFEPYIEKDGIYKPLKDKKLFNNFKLDGWTISWLNGTIDIAPEYLYENSIPCFDEDPGMQAAEEQAPYGK